MERTPSNNEDSKEPKENEQIEKNKEKFNRKSANHSAQEKTQVLQILEEFKGQAAEESAQEKRHVREKLEQILKNKAKSEPKRGEFGTEFGHVREKLEQIQKNKAESEPKRGEFGTEFEKFNRKSAEQNAQEKTQFLHILEEFKRQLAEQSAQEKAQVLHILAESEQEKRELKKTIEELKEKIAVSEQEKAKKERSKGFPGVTFSNKNKQISGEFKKKYAKTEQQTDELEKKIEECKETIAESEEQKRHMNIMIGELMTKYGKITNILLLWIHLKTFGLFFSLSFLGFLYNCFLLWLYIFSHPSPNRSFVWHVYISVASEIVFQSLVVESVEISGEDTTEQQKEECKETIALSKEQRKECKETRAESEEQKKECKETIALSKEQRKQCKETLALSEEQISKYRLRHRQQSTQDRAEHVQQTDGAAERTDIRKVYGGESPPSQSAGRGPLSSLELLQVYWVETPPTSSGMSVMTPGVTLWLSSLLS
ncbi:uncharacterized protein PF3D7_1120000-like [Saccopteryx leptura]|uniref:uncharacterized protein PF3D7_1120000-like n=1 Tax=Saccopteryx leptura TaxID=249018 RepID=UPI00339C2170